MTLLKTAKYLLIISCLFLAIEAQANCAWSNSACLDFGSSWATSSITFCTAPAGGAINCCCGPESEKGCCEKIDKTSGNKTTENSTREYCQNQTYAKTTFFKDFTAKNNNCTKEAVYDNCVWKAGKTTSIGSDGISMVSETGGCNSIEISPGSNSPYNCVPGDRTDPNQVCCCSQIKSETTTRVPRDFIFPGLQIPFPNLRLTPTSSLISEVNSDGSYFLSVPWIAEYISGAYNYGVGVVGILAAVILMAGGLMWLLSRGDASKTSTAKELIVGSVTGLIIIMTSSVLLDYINPELTKLRPVMIESIKSEQFELISESDYLNYTGEAIVPAFSLEMKNAIKDVATKKNIDPCIFIAIISKESAGNVQAIGHDENACSKTSCGVPSRIKFLKTLGINSCTNGGGCENKNNDKFPNLDWEYSHGFGLGQMTIFPGKFCSKTPSIQVGSKCYEMKELMTLQGSLDSMGELWISDKCVRTKYKDGEVGCFERYAGAGSHAKATGAEKLEVYKKCKQIGFDNIKEKDVK